MLIHTPGRKKKLFRKKLFSLVSFILAIFLFSCSGKGNAKGGVNGLDENLSQGQKQYHLRGCVKCHGIQGRGDGIKNALTGVSPRDFSDPSAFIQGYSLESISKTIKTGLVDKPGSIMPKYPFLTDEERDQIALYVLYLSTNQ